MSVSSKNLCGFCLAAEEVLAQLTEQLNRKKAQLQDAGNKLSQVQQAVADQVCYQIVHARSCRRSVSQKKQSLNKDLLS